MAQFQRNFVQELTKPLIIRQCGDLGFSGDNNSDVISVDLYTDGVAYSGGGTCAGACICPDGSTVALTGTVSGKTASVTLTEDCFAIPGQIGIGIRVTSGTTKTTVLKAIYNVEQFSTDNPVDPGSRISLDVADLVNRIDTAIASIPASADQLKAAMAPNFSDTTAYNAGAYVWNNGTLYKFTTAHAAGSWTGTDATAVALGNDVGDLRSASNNNSKIFTLISYKNPDEIKTYLGTLIKNGTYDSGNMKHDLGTNNRLCPMMFVQFGIIIRINANTGYQISRYIVDGTSPTTQTGSGWTDTLLFRPYVLSSLTIRRTDNGPIAVNEYDTAITIALEPEELQLTKINDFNFTTAYVVREHFSQIAYTQELYNIVLPQAIRNYLNNHLINGKMSVSPKMYLEDEKQLTLPFPIKLRTKIMMSVPTGYELHLIEISNEFFNSYVGSSGWKSAVDILPEKYYFVNFRKNGGSDTITPSDAPIHIYYGERYNEPIDYAVGANSNVMAIAHRGFAFGAPENTMAAYKMAVQRGFLYIESDVLWTKDHIPVMIHDATINRTSNGTGNVIDYTYEELLQYDFGAWFSSEFAGEKIPTFKEFIHYCKGAQVHPYIEVKTDQAASLVSDDVINTLIGIVMDEGMIDKCWWSSSGNGYLKRIYQRLPDAKLVYLVSDLDIDNAIAVRNADFPTASFQIRSSAITAEKLNKIKDANIQLNYGILDTEIDIRGADPYISGILSNRLVASTVLYDYAVNRQ